MTTQRHQQPDFDGEVFIVVSDNGDLEVLDERPSHEILSKGQALYIAYINGGDSELLFSK